MNDPFKPDFDPDKKRKENLALLPGLKRAIYILDAFGKDVIDLPHKGGIKLAADALVRELEEIRDGQPHKST